tara:strand:+ start:949 stop:2748 length:1800 start_codon:yes stop_codon:yes gene_type:complete
MSFPDLRAFIDQLKRDRDIVEITELVDPKLEAAEIHRRVIAANGPALLFTNVKDSRYPLVTNLYGTARRAELAFGSRPLQLIKRVVNLIETLMPPTFSKVWDARNIGLELLKIGTRRGRGGPITDIVTTDFNLNQLPALTTWPEDGGPFITLPLVFTEHPARPGHNLGMYRMQIHNANTTGMHWQIGKGGGFHYAVAEQQDTPLPVTVFLGGPPALMLAAIAPLPENVPELMLASLIAGERLKLSDGSWPSPLVRNAEFALIGTVNPRERVAEGPFGDHYGYYSLKHDYPVFHVKTLAHRKDAIFPATVVGKPRQEDFFIGDLLQELLSPLFPIVMPGVEKIWSYGETGYHSLSSAVVKERYAREAMASAFRILGEGQLSLTKFLLLTDQNVDLKEFPKTLEHILCRTNTETDLYVLSNLSMDTLDYTGPNVNEGSKGVWLGLGDPIRKLPRQFNAPEIPAEVTEVHVFCGGCLVVGTTSYQESPECATRIAQHSAFADWPLIILTDEPTRATKSAVNFLWTTFTRFEPAADIYARSTRVVRNHLAYTAPIVIDARLKPQFPKELSCDKQIAQTVTERWNRYFPEGDIEMGDSEQGHLD